ncbi:hypothetical protein PR202_gb14962 [Eleusine coracana subsp. coracana]|uniref:Uncharacterized protein n=1 Tax=Eleusine coracana subsp. coracana TaxID=191504 RepID=A0AAV5EWR2_ELECO|nr:hypothetical protein PR202_gb14962 [Eleusine coracana subsp. coracana]
MSVGVTRPTEGVLTGDKAGCGEVKAEVRTEQVKRALEKLMDGGADGDGMRSKVREFKAVAKAALEKGGSSHMNLDKLIHFAV